MIDVQQYDVFYQDFREEIRKIERTMDDNDELLINMASGTPAMKSALLVMSTLAEYRFKPIQVSTPQKTMNSEYEERKNYDPDENWECNLDNEEGAENRCMEVKCLNLMNLFKLEMIKKHIHAYDYKAALSIAEEIKRDIPEDVYRLLQIADARVKLNRRKISKLMQGKTYDIYPIKEGNKQKVFEYVLVLKIKLDREEYADFIRGITPMVVDLLEAILKKECGIALSDYCTVDQNGVTKWDIRKLKGTKLLEILNEEYREAGGFRFGPVYSGHMVKLIYRKCSDNMLKNKLDEIIYIESRARNTAAHEIVSVTDEWFKEKTGKTAHEIFAIIQFLVKRAGICAKNEDWESYDRMNELIDLYCR